MITPAIPRIESPENYKNLVFTPGVQHCSGLWCYPDAQRVAHVSIEQLRSVGLSFNKARAIAQISQLLSNQTLAFPRQVDASNIEQLRTDLLAIWGI